MPFIFPIVMSNHAITPWWYVIRNQERWPNHLFHWERKISLYFRDIFASCFRDRVSFVILTFVIISWYISWSRKVSRSFFSGYFRDKKWKTCGQPGYLFPWWSCVRFRDIFGAWRGNIFRRPRRTAKSRLASPRPPTFPSSPSTDKASIRRAGGASTAVCDLVLMRPGPRVCHWLYWDEGPRVAPAGRREGAHAAQGVYTRGLLASIVGSGQDGSQQGGAIHWLGTLSTLGP